MVSAAAFGLLAISFLLRYLRTHDLGIFIVYRLVFAAVVAVAHRAALNRMEVMKGLRQQAIRDLLDQRPIRTQQELVAALRERGFRATQATVSRDVADLGLIKRGARGVQAYALAESSGRSESRPGRIASPSCCATCPSRSSLPGCCSSSGPCPAVRTPSRPAWIDAAGPRWSAASRVTTRCSWHSPTAPHSSVSVRDLPALGVPEGPPRVAPRMAHARTWIGYAATVGQAIRQPTDA